MQLETLGTPTCSQQLTNAALKTNDLRGGCDIPNRDGFSNSFEIIDANHREDYPRYGFPRKMAADGGRLFRLQRLRDHDLALEVDCAQRSS
jgi:hypothetical protein